jgi:hypothetical protein
MQQDQLIPIHQWTHKGDKVLLVKCVDRDGKGHKGFQWPKSGTVRPDYCSMEPNCDSGGLFGWAWGLNIGGGKDPDYHGCWIVLAAAPALVVEVGSEKHKAAGEAEVVYYGDWAGAMSFTLEGRMAWFDQKTNGATDKATGWSGAASATGWSGAACLTGEDGAIEIGPKSAGVCTATEFTWVYRKGAVLLIRWDDGHRTLVADEMGYADGQRLRIVKGEILG